MSTLNRKRSIHVGNGEAIILTPTKRVKMRPYRSCETSSPNSRTRTGIRLRSWWARSSLKLYQNRNPANLTKMKWEYVTWFLCIHIISNYHHGTYFQANDPARKRRRLAPGLFCHSGGTNSLPSLGHFAVGHLSGFSLWCVWVYALNLDLSHTRFSRSLLRWSPRGQRVS